MASFKTWKDRTKTMRTSNDLAEAVRDCVSWLDYLVEHNDGGPRTTTAEDFDRLYELWRFSDNYDKLAHKLPRFADHVDTLFDMTLAALEISAGSLSYSDWLRNDGGIPENAKDEDEIREFFWESLNDLSKFIVDQLSEPRVLRDLQ